MAIHHLLRSRPGMDATAEKLECLVDCARQTVNEDVRRLAALATFNRLRPSNDITVEQFLASLQAHKELWAVVGSLGIVEFARWLAGPQVTPATEPQRRSRLTESQKANLKAAILRVLAAHPQGMSRTEITTAVVSAGLTPAGVKSLDLPVKVRQPLHELVACHRPPQLIATGSPEVIQD